MTACAPRLAGSTWLAAPAANCEATSSPDGSWVYTLYDGAGETPFVHALSTVDTYTVCIDLDSLEGRSDLSVLELALNPRTNILVVKRAGAVVATINTDGFEVTAVRAAPASRVAAANDAPEWHRPDAHLDTRVAARGPRQRAPPWAE